MGSDGVKIKVICTAWAKVVYGNKQLPELQNGSCNDLMLRAGGKHGRVIQGSATPSKFINGKGSVFMS